MYYITIEQSKKLLELGLNPKTADMCYSTFGVEAYPLHLILKNKEKLVPCWSLGALMELMPKICEDENDGGCYPVLCKGFNTDMWHCVYRSTIYITDWYKSSIDAAFEMMVWLLENGYIKTEKI